MSYQLVLTESVKTKDIGENVFFDNLPTHYKVFILIYPGVNADKQLVEKLLEFGEQTGNNCFVNIAKLNDPSYNKVRKLFRIMTFPTIIVTARSELSSLQSENITAFVRIDNKSLFKSTEATLACIEKMFNLFIDEKISEALKTKNRDQIFAEVRELFKYALKGLSGYLKEWDISFSFVTGTLVLKPRGS
jgi:hypothetical protein